jgi:hypothetical protein
VAVTAAGQQQMPLLRRACAHGQMSSTVATPIGTMPLSPS